MNDLIEMGQLDPADEKNLSNFFLEVEKIKSDTEEITNLRLNLQDLNEETKSNQSHKILRGLRDRINSDMVTVLRKARTIKTRLELLDKSNIDNRAQYKEGSPVDSTRIWVTYGLRVKLKEIMTDFQCLRERNVNEHKEGLERRYYSATGEDMIENRVVGGGKIWVIEGKGVGETEIENRERDEAVKEIQRSLIELHKVFLDMAVMVETQGEQMNNIEQNVVNTEEIANAQNVVNTEETANAPFMPTQRSIYILVRDVKKYTVHRCRPSSRINVFVTLDVTLMGLIWAMNLSKDKIKELNFRGFFVEGGEAIGAAEGEAIGAVGGEAIGAMEGDGGSARDRNEYYLRVACIGVTMCLLVVTTAATCRGINKIARFCTTSENYVKRLHERGSFGPCFLAPRTCEMLICTYSYKL